MPTLVARLRFLRLALIAAAVICWLKIWLHRRGWEPFASSPLVSALVAATVFLLGFLLSGVLSDYKESERLPGEMGAALQCLAQEVRCVALSQPECPVGSSLTAIAGLGEEILAWIQAQEPPNQLERAWTRLYRELAVVARWNPAPLHARLMTEVAALQRSIIRIATIRDTAFVPSVYLLASLSAALLLVGLLLSRSGSMHEPLFFLAILTMQLQLLLSLIADLDNPFDYGARRSFENVSLEPLKIAVHQVAEIARSESPAPIPSARS
jgi:hypothetical protein